MEFHLFLADVVDMPPDTNALPGQSSDDSMARHISTLFHSETKETPGLKAFHHQSPWSSRPKVLTFLSTVTTHDSRPAQVMSGRRAA